MDEAMVVVFAYGGLSPMQPLSAVVWYERFHSKWDGRAAYHMS
jgi:hypothetical protein